MKVEEVDEALIEGVCSRIREQLPAEDAERAEAVGRQYYRWLSPEDLAERSAAELFGATLAHFELAKKRKLNEPSLRVYNPTARDDGWESTHTAVEIVTDDMPFLVDSVTMELNRRGFGVLMIIHPVLLIRRDEDGNLVEILEPHSEEEATAESVIHVEVARHTDEDEIDEIDGHLHRVLNEVRAAVEDWQLMREKAFEIAADLDRLPPPPARSKSSRPRALPPHADEGQHPLHDPPRRVPGLRRRQALRRPRQTHRRAPFPWPLHHRGLPAETNRGPDPQAQGRGHPPQGGLPARQPQREGPE